MRFDDSKKVITDLYFSTQLQEINMFARDNQNNEIVIHIDPTTNTDINIFFQLFDDSQTTDLELFQYTVETFH